MQWGNGVTSGATRYQWDNAYHQATALLLGHYGTIVHQSFRFPNPFHTIPTPIAVELLTVYNPTSHAQIFMGAGAGKAGNSHDMSCSQPAESLRSRYVCLLYSGAIAPSPTTISPLGTP